MGKGLFGAIMLCCVVVTSASANTFDINFNDDSAQVQLDVTINRDDYGTSRFNGRFLYNDDEEVTLGSAGVRFSGEPGNIPGLEAGVGAQLYGGEAGETNSVEIGALGVGAVLQFAPPRLHGVGLDARAFYAPKIFTFLDTERLVETAARASYAITPKIRLHVEYQNVRLKVEDIPGTHSLDEEVRVGFTADF